MNKVLILCCTLTLAACSQSVTDYSREQPVLKLDKFFQGELTAWGVMHDWKGKQTQRFTAQLCGSWQGNFGDLYEVFQFSDGRTDTRHWHLTQDNDGSVTGTAGDVVGVAKGQLAGNSLFWQYTLRVPYKGDTLDVDVKDWMYLIDSENVINRSKLKRFGIKVGELTLAIQQQDITADCSAIKQQIAAQSE